MSEPFFAAGMEVLYSKLPEAWLLEDEKNDWVLKRWLSGVGDQWAAVEVMIDRFQFDAIPIGAPGDTSDLVDPAVADVAWLPWLAQLVGQKVISSNPAVTRARISSANKFRSGTKLAIAEACKGVLTGEQRVTIYDHTVTVPGDGGQWDLLILTKGSETVSSPKAEVIRLGAKPAGIILHESTFDTTWAAIEAALPTWGDWDTKTWTQIEEEGL